MNPGQIIFDGSLILAIGISIAAGLISFLSPCVLPLVPGYLGVLSGMTEGEDDPALRGGATGTVDGAVAAPTGTVVAGAAIAGGAGVRAGVATTVPVGHAAAAPAPAPAPAPVAAPVAARRARGRGRLMAGVLLFIGGFTAVFVTIFVLGGTVGLFFIEYSDVITRVMGVIVIALGLVFLGVFGFAQRTLRPEFRGRAGLLGAPLLGVAMGVGWAPCIGPTMGSILALSINTGDVGRAATLGVAYSLGLGIPFIVIALGFGWAAKSLAFLRRHIRVINLIGGGLLVALGLLMVTGLWNEIMSRLASVITSVELPL
ncbi:MAG: cytochrome c biogenesis CcdA family protein [Microbacteriaceae bacterium]